MYLREILTCVTEIGTNIVLRELLEMENESNVQPSGKSWHHLQCLKYVCLAETILNHNTVVNRTISGNHICSMIIFW